MGRPVRAGTPSAEEAGGLNTHDRVTAVVVAHDGHLWLPATLTVLGEQTRAPDAIVAVDVGSSDDSADILVEALGADRVHQMAAPSGLTGFGEAVQAGVSTLSTEQVTETEWLWLLHDDSAPDPDCLSELLAAAQAHPRAVILGAKARGWHDRRLLLEVGFTITGSGRRFTDLDAREHDQGQHDARSEVHAVGSGGMLIRRDIWQALGGFDAALPLYRDDLDLCWRVWRAGHEVRVVPAAVVHHREASFHGRRVGSTRPGLGHRLDRRGAVHTLLTHTPAWRLPLTSLRLLLGSFFSIVVSILGKAPRRAVDEALAWASVLAHPGRLRAARQAAAATSVLTSRAAVGEFRPGFSVQTRQAVDALSGSLSAGRGDRASTSSSGGARETGPGDDAMDLYDDPAGTWLRRVLTRPGMLLALALIVLSVAATRALWWGDGVLLGGALLPTPAGASDLWGSYTQMWHDVGPGSTTPSPAWMGLLAAFATLLLGKAPFAVNVILLLAVPMAGLAAWWSLRGIISSTPVRVWMSVAYALLPAVLGATAAGRLGTAAAAVFLPVTMRAFVRVLPVNVRGLPKRSARTPWWTALLLAALTACAPVLWPIALVVALVTLVWWLLRGHAQQETAKESSGSAAKPAVLLRVAVAVGVPLLLLVPWSLHVITAPGLILLEPGLPGPVDPQLDALDLALMHPGGPGMMPIIFSVGVLAAGVLALLRVERRSATVAILIVGVLGLVTAIGMSLVRVGDPSSSGTVTPWPGPATLLWGAALVIAAGFGADGLRQRMADAAFGWRQPVAFLAAMAAVAAPVLAALWWLPGAGDPLRRATPGVLPSFVAAEALGPQAPRTLVVRPASGGAVDYTLINGSGPSLGDADVGPPSSVWAPLDALVSTLVSGRGGPEVAALADYAVRYIVAEVEQSSSLVRNLDSVPGLRRVAAADGEVLWRISGVTARVRAIPEAGSNTANESIPLTVTDIDSAQPLVDSPVPGPGELFLAQDADAPWRAVLADGSTLPADPIPTVTEDAALQRFILPDSVVSGDRVTIDVDGSSRTWWLWGQLIALVVVAVLALPGRRTNADIDDIDDADAIAASDDAHQPLNDEEEVPDVNARADL